MLVEDLFSFALDLICVRAYGGVEGGRVHQTCCFMIGEHEGIRP